MFAVCSTEFARDSQSIRQLTGMRRNFSRQVLLGSREESILQRV